MTKEGKENLTPIPLHNNKPLVKSMDLEHHLQTANQMLMENSNQKVEFVIDVGKVNINQHQKCAAIDATCNKCGKKGQYAW